MVKYTPQFLSKLEDSFAEWGYIVRYEKGNFKAGYCLLKDTKVVIVNKFFNTESRITCLLDILKTLDLQDTPLPKAKESITKMRT